MGGLFSKPLDSLIEELEELDKIMNKQRQICCLNSHECSNYKKSVKDMEKLSNKIRGSTSLMIKIHRLPHNGQYYKNIYKLFDDIDYNLADQLYKQNFCTFNQKDSYNRQIAKRQKQRQQD